MQIRNNNLRQLNAHEMLPKQKKTKKKPESRLLLDVYSLYFCYLLNNNP